MVSILESATIHAGVIGERAPLIDEAGLVLGLILLRMLAAL